MTQISSELQLQNRAMRAKADIREGRIFDASEAKIILDFMNLSTKNTFSHPITGEKLYSPEELDAVTTQYIEDQCAVLAKNLILTERKGHLSDYECVFDTPVTTDELLKSF